MNINKRLLFRSPGPGTIVNGCSFYLEKEGGKMQLTRTLEMKDDIFDSYEIAFSEDYGNTWSDFTRVPVKDVLPNGTRRWNYLPAWIDPTNGNALTLGNEGVFPNDLASDAAKHMFLKYRVSPAGETSFKVEDSIVQTGYTAEHPFEGVFIGKNGMQIGDIGCKPIRTQEGKIIIPGQLYPTDEKGNYYNPYGTITYTDLALIMGTWQDNHSIKWDKMVQIRDKKQVSTRGFIEPTMMVMPDGRIMMVIRGSNEGQHDKLPGRKWLSVSEDHGHTWSPIEAWTYDNGEEIKSPSSFSTLIKHSSGDVYWFGNIPNVPGEEPWGNGPRRPLVMGKVDTKSLKLIKDSVITVDDIQPGEPKRVNLTSNFYVYEDRQTKELVLHFTRAFPGDWIGHAYQYRIL